ncbi:MAG: CatB-related O-acetyltransferase [Selenomonadaceae bacterium]|nr:CatB-related O-acetyltransferase [Selenomonadaceae bacterium]
MSAVKALIFGIDELFPILKPYYDREVEKGNLDIFGYAAFINDKVVFAKNLQGEPLTNLSFDKIIISSENNFMIKFKISRELINKINNRGGGINLNNVIDGRIFQIPNFDLKIFLKFNIISSILADSFLSDNTKSICLRIYNLKAYLGKVTCILDVKSYMVNSLFSGKGLVCVGKFSSIARNVEFELSRNGSHNYNNVSNFSCVDYDWNVSKEFFPKFYDKDCEIIIGSDVWIGQGSKFKSANPGKPLIIGNGAVIASDSVVVKDVPPYAIVGGNPAKIIKYRFDEATINSLERIQWWNWDLEKIYDNFHMFKDPVAFAKKFDPKK